MQGTMRLIASLTMGLSLGCAAAPAHTTDATNKPSSDACVLDDVYTFGTTGGLVPGCGWSKVMPPLTYSNGSDRGDGSPVNECVNTMSCTDDFARDLVGAFADPNVRKAFDAGGIYGVDTRAADGQVFFVERSDHRRIIIGNACSADVPQCVPIPAALTTLVARLRALQVHPWIGDVCHALPTKPADCRP
jgi:hypothetical protein